MVPTQTLAEEILDLKKQRNAVILAHHYQDSEIQELADVVGDSLELARKAKDFSGEVIAFCGVWFMAETAKVLNATRTVVVPDKDAGCSLVDSCPVEQVRAYKQRHPDHVIVSYINTSVEVKAESDILCTSRNAAAIVNSIPADRPILFLPDINLGNWVKKETGRQNMKIWQGACVVHATFPARRVVAGQHGHAIFSLEASFQIEEKGLEHQFPMPLDVPGPEGLPTQRELLQRASHVPEAVRRFWARERPLEIRPVNLAHYESRDKLPPRQNVWIRLNGPVPKERALQSVLLAYLSDMTLLDTSTFAHGRGLFDPDIQAASLDHAMWFHRSHPLDDWLLYTQDSPSASGSRGFNRGALYARDGTLIASTAQEGLIRLRRQPK